MLGGDYCEVGTDEIRANPWNPNMMKEKEFDRLVREISESGMIAPIQIVPMTDETGSYYRIIGGDCSAMKRFQLLFL